MASPKSTLPPTNPDEQDSRYNPAEQAYQEKMGAGYVSSGLDQAESFANDPKNSAQAAKEAEESAVQTGEKEGFYRPSAGGSGGKSKVTMKGVLKKRGALATIAALLLGGGGLASFLFAPGLGLVQLKEIMTEDLNDQLAAFDLRTDAMWRSRLSNMSSGICTGAVQIKCKFQSMSDKQIKKFRAAGFTIPDDGLQETAFGRKRITSMTAPNGETIRNPQDLFNQRRDPSVRSAMNRVFNPIYASMSDSIANKVLGERFKTSKEKKLKGTSTEELDDSMRAATAGDTVNTAGTPLTDEESGKRYFVGDDGQRIYEGDPGFDTRLAEYEEANSKFNDKVSRVEAGGKAVGSVLGGAIKGVSVLGAADSACTVYNTARAVAASAKAIRAIQLAQYAMTFLNTADSIKAGTATPEEVEYLGNILTATDTNEKIVDELSETSGGTVDQAVDNAKERDNPFYGKNAFDSPGYAVAAYNDAPVLTSRSQQYMVGGGLSGTLSSVTTNIANTLQVGPEGIRAACGNIQSWWARGAGIAVGVIAAIGSFGVTTALSIGASLVVSIALPFLEAALADIVAGQVVNPDTKGVDAGDAIFSGSAALMGGVAQARGLKPLTSSELEPYLAQNQEINNQYIAQARYEARSTPFDIMNQYSFLGSFARSINIPVTKATSSVNGFLAAIPQIFTTSLNSIIPSVNAQQAYNPDRFTKCKDEGYEELGIAADVFCNVRYGLTQEDLSRDPVEVVDWMYENGHIDELGNTKSGSLFEKFITHCVERADGWGETGEEGSNDWTTGKACMGTSNEVSAEQLSYFRTYTIDRTVAGAMDEEEVDFTAASDDSGTGTPPIGGNTDRPEGAVDKDRGWTFAPNAGGNFSQYPCDPRTQDMGVFTSPRYGYTMRLCRISFNTGWEGNPANGSSQVASVISTNLMNMFEAARADGVELALTDGMRKDGGSYSYYSEHATGLALDLATPTSGSTICYGGNSQTGYGTPAAAEAACRARGGAHYQAYQWLQQHAADYGFHNYLVEPWHWSTSGS